MAKKLKVSLELDTAAARRKLSGLSASAGGGPSTSRLSSAFESASKSVEKTAGAFDKMEGKAAELTRGFAGIAIGMATTYASNYVSNPNVKAGFGYAGNILTGAATGAMFGGPIGAVVGGVAGAATTYMANEGERSAMSADFEKSEKIFAAVRAKNALFDDLSDIKAGTDIAANLAKAKEIIENYTESTADFVAQVRGELEKMHPDKEKIADLRRNIDYNRGEIQRYERLVKTLESQESQDEESRLRGSLSALDSLGKVGGNFVGGFASKSPAAAAKKTSAARFAGGSFGFSVGGPGTETTEFSARSEGLLGGFDAALKTANDAIEKIDADQLAVLKDIKATLEKQGGATWH